MLALYYVCGHDDPKALVGIDRLMDGLGLARLSRVQRAVLIGMALSPNEIWMRGGVAKCDDDAPARQKERPRG
jgi:hypothetical protein